MLRETAEQTIISVSGKVAAGGSVTAVGSGITAKALTASAENPEIVANAIAWADIGVMTGIVVAVGGLIIQLVFSIRKDRRETHVFNATMSGLTKKP